MTNSDDKILEYQRYDKRASSLLSSMSVNETVLDVASLLPEPFIKPYLVYEEAIHKRVDRSSYVLEIGSGCGLHTTGILQTGAKVIATDISENSLKVLNKNLASKFTSLKTEVADMEALPFEANLFDTVCCAGSLSYGDNKIVMDEVYRVLKKGGVFICVDSLNHNPIYKMNRWLHFLRGNRTMNTLKRMPTIPLLDSYGKKFGSSEVYFFGAISWLSPLLCKLINESKVAEISERFDELFKTKKSAFKFVMIVKKD